MNFSQLEYFISVAELRSFTKAASKHYLTQAAITQQIQALEDQVGKALINRKSRPIELTAAGSVFLGECKSIISHTNRAIDLARNASEGMSGHLRIGYIKGYEHTELPGTLRSFHEKYPNIMLSCYRRKTDELAHGLINGEFDIVYTWDSTNVGENSFLTTMSYKNQKLVVALNSEHPLATRASLTRGDLANEDLLFMTPAGTGDTLGDAHYISLYQEAGFNPNIILNTSDYESILMMISAGIGVSVVPEYCINTLINVSNIIFVPLVGEHEYEEISVMWLTDSTNPALYYYIDMLALPSME